MAGLARSVSRRSLTFGAPIPKTLALAFWRYEVPSVLSIIGVPYGSHTRLLPANNDREDVYDTPNTQKLAENRFQGMALS